MARRWLADMVPTSKAVEHTIWRRAVTAPFCFSGCLSLQQPHQILFTRAREFIQRHAAQLGNDLGNAQHVGRRVLVFRLPKGAVGFQ